MQKQQTMRALVAGLVGLSVAWPDAIAASEPANALVSAYPDHLTGIEGTGANAVLVWKDGTQMVLGAPSGAVEKPIETWLAAPDLRDILRFPYPVGEQTTPPPLNVDPGRARPTAFFQKMYGDCTKAEVTKFLVDVVWLPKKSGKSARTLKVTRVNGVADRLRAISDELDALPSGFDIYLLPSEGTYTCRPIAGTSSPSAHGLGIAIDIATRHAHYWRWSKGGAATYQNRIPPEIVRIFEAHGFIWGGKWYHYDTMHFEYRPELMPPTATLKPK
jgi:D-alanyl-D-alanine carboxypeptidase